VTESRSATNPILAGVLGWIVPGLGHFVMGRRAKAILFFVLVMGLFIAGWLLSGRRDVYIASDRWHALVQLGIGPLMYLISLLGRAPENPNMTSMTYFEIFQLYTMVAGLLNVLVIMDAVLTSLRLRKGQP
jgi:hypothetical protein